MSKDRGKNRNSIVNKGKSDKSVCADSNFQCEKRTKTELWRDQCSSKKCVSKESIYYKDIYCNCEWEIKFGYAVALTLVIFEAKRFFVLLLEIFLEWQLLRFAGGTQPVILTFVDITVGLPSALIAVRTIRKRKVMQCRTRTKQLLEYLLLIIGTCIILNILTLASIGYHISVRRETLIDVFSASMRLYLSATTYKYAIDEIQFTFQCCGRTTYRDWFLIDWQRVDYATRIEMDRNEEDKISDEEYRNRAVPFSCCNVRATVPCVHTQITDRGSSSVNSIGCVEIVAPILLRIVLVAYVMTSTLIITQTLLAFLVSRMIDGIFRWNCEELVRSFEPARQESSACNCCGSKWQAQPTVEKPEKRKRRTTFRLEPSYSNGHLDFISKENNGEVESVASIEPTIHQEHRIRAKRTLQ